MSEKKKTVGAHAFEKLQEAPESRDPIELEREMHKNYEGHFWETFNEGKKTYDSDFYIVVLTKKERLMENVLRNYFLTRSTCPTPDYDQAVYRYSKEADAIEFLWVIPDKHTCMIFKDNALQIDPSERELRDYVLDFADGTLYAKAKQLNKELSFAVS